MSSSLGKFLRKLRIDRDELLKNMADRLEMSSAMLSSIENEKRKAPRWFADRLAKAYGLDDKAKEEIEYLVETTGPKKGISIDTASMSEGDQRLAFAFARKFSDLEDADKERLRRLLGKEGE